jgi:endonuclease/exonuclease/phosphatase (EEP) superfamily protein YafD
LRLLLANVLGPNRSHARLLALAAAENPDLIALVEPTAAWQAGLRPLEANYPHCLAAVREDNYGLLLYSRLPFETAETLVIGPAGIPTLAVRLRAPGGGAFRLVVTHPPPPKTARQAADRDAQLAELACLAAGRSEPWVVCGDFNLSPWSPHFKRLLAESDLRDSGAGFGVQATWPVDRPLLRTPIDHILLSGEITAAARRLGAQIGSDHLPVIVDLRFRNSIG